MQSTHTKRQVKGNFWARATRTRTHAGKYTDTRTHTRAGGMEVRRACNSQDNSKNHGKVDRNSCIPLNHSHHHLRHPIHLRRRRTCCPHRLTQQTRQRHSQFTTLTVGSLHNQTESLSNIGGGSVRAREERENIFILYV